MKPPFDNLAKLSYEHALKCLIGTKAGTGLDPTPEMLTSFIVIKPNGKWDLIGTPWNGDKEKREAVLSVAMHILAEGAIGYCFTSEVWLAESKHEGDKLPPPIGKRPRERPDRKEAVICLMSDGNKLQFQAWMIERDSAGVCTALKEKEGPGRFESWIADTLDRALKLSKVTTDAGPLGQKLREKVKELLEKARL